MGQAKRPKARASIISSAADPSASSKTLTTSNSSILKSSFIPSRFQLCLFASVIYGLGSQHLRIHDSTTGRLVCEHALTSRASINCLTWGYRAKEASNHYATESKKRKRREDAIGDVSGQDVKNIVLAFGTSDSEIHLFSPSEAKVVQVLKDGHAQGVRDFKFIDDGLQGEAWSIGGDGRLIQWDIKKSRATRTLTLQNGPASTIFPVGSSIICASHQAYVLNPGSPDDIPMYGASTNPVQYIIGTNQGSSPALHFLTSAVNDHFINVFDQESTTLVGSLRSDNGIISLDYYSRKGPSTETEKDRDLATRLRKPQQALATVNRDGILEVFSEPFDFGVAANDLSTKNLKARMKQRSRRASAQVRVRRPDPKPSTVPLINSSFKGNHIVLAWVEGGVNPVFDTILWRDEESGKLLLNEEEIIKGKGGSGLDRVALNGVKDMGNTLVDESRTVVVAGGEDTASAENESREIIDISSGDQESDFEEDSEPEPRASSNPKMEGDEAVMVMENGENHDDGDVVMEEAQEAGEEPSFGQLLRAKAPETVEVQDYAEDVNAQSLVPAGERSLGQLPSSMSLGTVLTQSLRTNDTNLLETCFHVKDLATVRATIERLDSCFATRLLQNLAERLHSRPGRAGSLMVWIQWTLVAHGGYLAGRPEVMKKLASLHRVVRDRANGLQSLLSLKGKLDMLEAQMNLRRSMHAKSTGMDVEDEEDGVIYVEGQEDTESEEEAEENDESGSVDSTHISAGAKPSVSADALGVEALDEAELDPKVHIADSEEEEDDSESDNMFDDEASSTDQDTENDFSGESINHDSVDTDSSEDDLRHHPESHPKPRN